MNPDRVELIEQLAQQRARLANECPDDIAGSYRNGDETMILGAASSDESRIRILGDLASADKINPLNSLFFLDVAHFFDDPKKALDAQRLAEYNQLPNNRIGRIEKFVRRVVHPSLRKYVNL